ncbi:putative glycosyl transferase CAP10 domain-containing protein [Helianthus annuus]|nr:putative glycosyl transferase CAP10 domain-containing protein [Helianthus annuus]
MEIDRIYDYMYHLIVEYAELLDFKPVRPISALEECVESLYCFADQNQTQLLARSATRLHKSLPANSPRRLTDRSTKGEKENYRFYTTWVGSLSQTGFTGNFTVVPTGGWVTGFSPELVVDSGYSRSTPFVQWVPRECSGLSLLAVQKKKKRFYTTFDVIMYVFKIDRFIKV